MRDLSKLLEHFRETLNELLHDDPWINSCLDPIAAALDERDALREALGTLAATLEGIAATEAEQPRRLVRLAIQGIAARARAALKKAQP